VARALAVGRGVDAVAVAARTVEHVLSAMGIDEGVVVLWPLRVLAAGPSGPGWRSRRAGGGPG